MMSFIQNVIRQEILDSEPYVIPDSTGLVKLDSMENPYLLPEELRIRLGQYLSEQMLNRYPTASYRVLKDKICLEFGVPSGFDVMLGNGSDELISILSVTCAKPGAKVLTPVPAFVMYEMAAQFAGMEFVGIPLRPDFSLDCEAMVAAIKAHRPVITYLAYPNNPTGNLFEREAICTILEAVGDAGIVVVDEAYSPFALRSFMSELPKYPNLVVMRTVSKLGLAGIRLGYMSASAELLEQFDKVRPPYNVNILTEAAATFILEHKVVLDDQAACLRADREQLALALKAIEGISVFPSSANFLLFRVHSDKYSGHDIYKKLLKNKVLIKNVGKMHVLLENCLRVTIGTPHENDLFIIALKKSLEA